MTTEINEETMLLLSSNNITGCPTSTFDSFKTYYYKTKPFWPLVGKVKMRLRAVQIYKISKQTAENVNKNLLLAYEMYKLQTHFGFTN